MKGKDFAIIGAIAIAGYLLYKYFTGQPTGGAGGGGGGITLPVSVPGETSSMKVLRTVVRVGGREAPIGVPYNPRTGQVVGKYAAHITTGTPYQQIVQYSMGPKVVKINGKSYKVM